MYILILGHKDHGKDYLAEKLVGDFKFKYETSSMAAKDLGIFDGMEFEFGENFYEDRKLNPEIRKQMYLRIFEYNRGNLSRLALTIHDNLQCDVYTGMRDSEELKTCLSQGIFDLVIWLEDSSKPKESTESFPIQNLDIAELCTSHNTLLFRVDNTRNKGRFQEDYNLLVSTIQIMTADFLSHPCLVANMETEELRIVSSLAHAKAILKSDPWFDVAISPRSNTQYIAVEDVNPGTGQTEIAIAKTRILKY